MISSYTHLWDLQHQVVCVCVLIGFRFMTITHARSRQIICKRVVAIRICIVILVKKRFRLFRPFNILFTKYDNPSRFYYKYEYTRYLVYKVFHYYRYLRVKVKINVDNNNNNKNRCVRTIEKNFFFFLQIELEWTKSSSK